MKPRDTITINKIRCYGYTGYLAAEKVLGQWFEVDLTLWLDLAPASNSDAIEDTLDYRRAIEIVKKIISNVKYDLVEKLAGAIAEEVLQLHLIDRVQVKLTKLAPPIPDFSGSITIEIVRSK